MTRLLPPAFAKAATFPDMRYKNALIIDGQGAIAESDPKIGPEASPSAQLIDAIRTSGMTAICLTVGSVGNGRDRFESTVEGIAAMERLCALHPDLLMTIRSASDLRHAKKTGRVGVIYNLQDTTALESNLTRIGQLSALGVRIIQLTYNKRNLAGDGALESADGGLAAFGREIIAELNAKRVLLDLSHGGRRTILESIAATKAPPAITHSGCRALVDYPRNVDDTILRALAAKGGVIGIYFMPFLRNRGQAEAADVIAHIEHAVNVCGEDHVGIGTDGVLPALKIDDAARTAQRSFYEERRAAGIAAPGEAADVFNIVEAYNTPRRFKTLADDLFLRGWSTTRIEKILGGNFARLFGDVWGS